MPDPFLPKPLKDVPPSPLDLPKPELDLPLPEKELPAGQKSAESLQVSPETSGDETENVSMPPPKVSAQYAQEQTRSFVQQEVDPQQQYPSYTPTEVRTLLSWEGMGRQFKQHGREYYINASLIVMIVEVILFLFSQYVLMLVVISMLFVVVALAIVPPHTVRYRISTEGIGVDEYFYLWQELYDFYFKRLNGEDVLHIRTKDEYATDISMLLGQMHREHLQSILLQYLPYRESVPYTFLEKSGDWLSRTFPLDNLSK